MTEAETAWLAGLFEGEGNIAFVGRHSVVIRINMCDEDVIARCAMVTQTGSRYVVPANERLHRKPQYAWVVGDQDHVRPILEAIAPWMGDRRGARIKEALIRLSHIRRHGFCIRGHRIRGFNLYISPEGQRHCRACARARDRERDMTPERLAWDRARDKNPKRIAQKRAAMARYVERQRAIKLRA